MWTQHAVDPRCVLGADSTNCSPLCGSKNHRGLSHLFERTHSISSQPGQEEPCPYCGRQERALEGDEAPAAPLSISLCLSNSILKQTKARQSMPRQDINSHTLWELPALPLDMLGRRRKFPVWGHAELLDRKEPLGQGRVLWLDVPQTGAGFCGFLQTVVTDTTKKTSSFLFLSHDL